MLLAIALQWLLLREGVKMSCFLSLLFLHSSTLSQEKHSLCLSQIVCSFPSLGSKEALVAMVMMDGWLDWMSLVVLSLTSRAWTNSRNTHKCTGAELGRGWCPAVQLVFIGSFDYLEAACLSFQYSPSNKYYRHRPFQMFGNVWCSQFNQQQSILSQDLHQPSSPSKAVSLPRKQGDTQLFWHYTEVGYFLSFSTSIVCVNSHHAAEWGLSGNDRVACAAFSQSRPNSATEQSSSIQTTSALLLLLFITWIIGAPWGGNWNESGEGWHCTKI